jgi:predicted secreted Zn-dependent protease
MTTSSLATELKCQEYSDGGALRTATIKLSLVVNLPVWQEASQAPVALQQSWDNFSRALRAHEEGHVRIASNYAAALRKALLSLRVAESCSTLLTRAVAITHRAEARMTQAQADYDTRTMHGGTQGCVL